MTAPLISDQFEDEYAERMAEVCLATGIQPSEYAQLTEIQVNAFIKVANKRSK